MLLKLGFEYKIESMLIDFGFALNSIDESFSNVDASSNTVTGDYWGTSFSYFTVSYLF